jgi:hypothetical protein
MASRIGGTFLSINPLAPSSATSIDVQGFELDGEVVEPHRWAHARALLAVAAGRLLLVLAAAVLAAAVLTAALGRGLAALGRRVRRGPLHHEDQHAGQQQRVEHEQDRQRLALPSCRGCGCGGLFLFAHQGSSAALA